MNIALNMISLSPIPLKPTAPKAHFTRSRAHIWSQTRAKIHSPTFRGSANIVFVEFSCKVTAFLTVLSAKLFH